MSWPWSYATLNAFFAIQGITAVIAGCLWSLQRYSPRIGVVPALAVGVIVPIVAFAPIYALTFFLTARSWRLRDKEGTNEMRKKPSE
jgi:hypothetical protein